MLQGGGHADLPILYINTVYGEGRELQLRGAAIWINSNMVEMVGLMRQGRMNNKFPKSNHRFNAFNQKLGAYYPDALLIIIMRPAASLTGCYIR